MPNKLFTVFKNKDKESTNVTFEIENTNKEKECFVEIFILPENYDNYTNYLFHRGPISKRNDNRFVINNIILKSNESIGIIISHSEVMFRIIENNVSTTIEESD